MKNFSKSQLIISSAVSLLLGLVALQIPFTRLMGSSVKFTLFDFVAPTAGAFLGTFPGIIAVLLSQIINIAVHGTKTIELGTVIRLIPILFGTAYFANKRVLNLIVPIVAIVAFNANPIGRSAWQYSLFWVIPVVAYFFHKNIFARSLGATFTTHAVGGALWVWTFGLNKTIWLALIPQTAMERTVMTAGIVATYYITNWAITHAHALKFFGAKKANHSTN